MITQQSIDKQRQRIGTIWLSTTGKPLKVVDNINFRDVMVETQEGIRFKTQWHKLINQHVAHPLFPQKADHSKKTGE